MLTAHTTPSPRPRNQTRPAHTSRARRAPRVLLALASAAATVVPLALPAGPAPAASTPVELVSQTLDRPGGRGGISAYFVLPARTVAANTDLLRAMGADAITFGSRLRPARAGQLPPQVTALVGTRRAYFYSAPVQWARAARHSSDRTVRVAGVTYTLIQAPNHSVVITRSGADAVAALIKAGNRLHARTIIGLPAPAAGAPGGPAWMPNTTYLPVLTSFTGRFVRNAHLLGADGYYQHVEMPATNTPVWKPVRTLYKRQNAAVNKVAPGALMLLSPYLESRRSKASFTPAQAAAGVRMLLAGASGTRLVIAPQDGLGVGSTRLSQDGRRNLVRAPLQSYLSAMRAVAGERLWVNAELMRPAPNGGRLPTTRHRVSQQLWTHAHYGTRTIAFMWDDPTRGLGATRVPGGVTHWSTGFGTAR